MSLRPQSVLPLVPDDTTRVAQTAFRRGNSYLLLRDHLGPIFADTQTVALPVASDYLTGEILLSDGGLNLT